MKDHLLRRLISAAAAAALSCTLCMSCLPVSAEDYETAKTGFEDARLVEVIVELNGDAVLASPAACGKGAAYIDSAEAKAAEALLREKQDKAEEYIRNLYPGLEIKHRFTLTLNGFDCAVPETLISAIKQYPPVSGVSEVITDIIPEPQLVTAKELCGVPEFINNTGCTGEGEVIAVIDTEFDVTHDMFAPLTATDVKLTKDDISEISSTDGFSSELNADEVYISSKIPFAYDYSDDTPYTLSSPSSYHGTHVSGIAAGNRMISSDGSELSGIAPDAQLLLMKVFENSIGSDASTVSDSAIAAAIEDAVKLKADVINMSFGRIYEHYEKRAYAGCIRAASNAGIIICASAGNKANDNKGYGEYITVENVDTGNINEPAIFPQVISAASANNTEDGSISVSEFSSYGVGTSLDLKPEIMGIGGNILSAAYDNELSLMSGTSMASPYIAGCAALFDEYIKKQGLSVSVSEKTQLIKNILMNSAVPVTENGIAVSPRRQGAGLAAIDMAVDDKAIMTGVSGKAAVELRDRLGDEFSFELNIKNISSEDVTFTDSSLRLTSDGYEYSEKTGKNYISGQTVLSSENDLSRNITIPAGETVSITVNVSLDSAQTSELGKIFTNGFFVEGFITLSGAENCCDISIPVIGFYGDWCAVPTIDTDRYPLIPKATIGTDELRTDMSFSKAADFIRGVVRNDKYLLSLDPENPERIPDTLELTEEQKDQFNALIDGSGYFSPDNNCFGDFFGCYYVPTREAMFTDIDLYSADDELIYSTRKSTRSSFRTCLGLLPDNSYSLPDGTYTGKLFSYIEYGDADEKKQCQSFNVVLDTVKPKVKQEITEENGRKLIKLTVSDSSLDGIYIMGMKQGNMNEESRINLIALAVAQKILSGDPLPETNKTIMSNYDTFPMKENLSDFQSVLTGNVRPQSYYNFCEIIPAETDENGVFTLTYDITELSEYTITVADRAFNETALYSEEPQLTEFRPGVWKARSDSDDKFYEFGENGYLSIIDTYCKESYYGEYSINDGLMYYTQHYTEDPLEINIKWSSPERAVLYWKDLDMYEEVMFVQEGSIWDYPFYSNDELSKMAENYYLYTHNVRPGRASCYYNDGKIDVCVYDENNVNIETYTVIRETGEGVNKAGEPVDLKKGTYFKTNVIWKGRTITDDLGMTRYFQFTEFDERGNGKGYYISSDDNTAHEFDCFVGGSSLIGFSFESYKDSDEPATYARIIPVDAITIGLEWTNGMYEELTYNNFITRFDEVPELNVTENKLGDVNHDGIINAVDASEILVLYAEMSSFSEKSGLYYSEDYDINRDGLINAVDASLLLGYYADLAGSPDLTLEAFLEKLYTTK